MTFKFFYILAIDTTALIVIKLNMLNNYEANLYDLISLMSVVYYDISLISAITTTSKSAYLEI